MDTLFNWALDVLAKQNKEMFMTNPDCKCAICNFREKREIEDSGLAEFLKADLDAQMRRAFGVKIEDLKAPKKPVEPATLLGKTVRYKLKARDKGLLTVVAVYDPRYKNYENSKDNIRVKNEKGSMWTAHSDDVYEVKEVKTYAFQRNDGQILQFVSEEAGQEEMKRRARDMTRTFPHPNHVKGQLTRASEYDMNFGDKEA